jgi:hypothetical protein
MQKLFFKPGQLQETTADPPLCRRMTMKSKSNNKKQIPFGDDNQRCNSNGKNNGKCAVEAGKLLGG